MAESFREEGFADVGHLLPIGGDVTCEIAALDRSLLLVANRAREVDKAGREGMWRTWMLDALDDAAKEAHAAVRVAHSSVPRDRPELLVSVERRRAGLSAFMARYPGRET